MSLVQLAKEVVSRFFPPPEVDSRHRVIAPNQPVNPQWHRNFIVYLANILRPKVYVELGLSQCQLFNLMIPYAQQLIGVDIDPKSGTYMQQSSKARFVNASTDEFVKELRDDPIQVDLLFIDADHSREAVLKDFWNFFPFVAPHGLILLHDGHPGSEEYISDIFCGTAYQAVAELSRHTDEYEMMTLPVHPGLTICRKRKEQLRWKEISEGK